MEIYFQLVNDAEGLKKACDELKNVRTLGFDVETTALEPFAGELRLVQLSDGRNTKVIDLRAFGGRQETRGFSDSAKALLANPDLAPLRDLLTNPKITKIAHNAKFDTKWVRHHLGCEVGGVYDSYLASILVSAGEGQMAMGIAQQRMTEKSQTPKQDFQTFNEVYGEYFAKIGPTRTTVEVTSLPTAIAVELKVVAYQPRS